MALKIMSLNVNSLNYSTKNHNNGNNNFNKKLGILLDADYDIICLTDIRLGGKATLELKKILSVTH